MTSRHDSRARPRSAPTSDKYASGETDVTGHITKCGDKAVRALLCEAANVLLTRVSRWSWVKHWGLEVLKRRGKMRARSRWHGGWP